MREIQKNYLIIVYTASHQSYADSVLDYLDPDHEIIKYRLYRHNCVRVQMESEFIYVKDLRIFKNVRMQDMIIIDNSVLSFAFQLENGIPILPFYDNKDDTELIFLKNYLNNIHLSSDLRIENNRSIKMNYFLNAVKEKMEPKESNNDSSLSDETYNNSSNQKDLENNKNNSDNANNNNFMFKINLFSADANTQNESVHESSFSNSDSSHNDSEISTNNNNNITNGKTNKIKDNQKYNITSKFFGNSNDTQNSETFNTNTEKNMDYGTNKSNKRNNIFQEKLFSTLDDLKKTFTQLSEKKRNTIIDFNNKN